MRKLGIPAFLACALAVPLGACKADKVNVDEGKEMLDELTALTPDLPSWQARVADVRAGILEGALLSPLPQGPPIDALLFDRVDHDGYSVENVAFESVPGFWVTGNLYRPLGRGDGPFPAILHPHGHFDSDGYTPRTMPEMQALSAQLARMGAIVFAYDMVGYGDADPVAHMVPGVLGLQLWNSVRVVDFFETLPDADQDKIFALGASGGAVQAILVAAVDPRVHGSAPLIMLSATYDGGDICEIGMPVRLLTDPRSNNVEIAAMTAPHPLLVVSDGDDWTETVPTIEMPYLRHVYEVNGAPDAVVNVHLLGEDHDLGPSKRNAVYDFAVSHLGLDGTALPEAYTLEPAEALQVWTDAHPRPPGALQDAGAVFAEIRDMQEQQQRGGSPR